jgi:hypothetical protein
MECMAAALESQKCACITSYQIGVASTHDPRRAYTLYTLQRNLAPASSARCILISDYNIQNESTLVDTPSIFSMGHTDQVSQFTSNWIRTLSRMLSLDMPLYAFIISRGCKNRYLGAGSLNIFPSTYHLPLRTYSDLRFIDVLLPNPRLLSSLYFEMRLLYLE